MKHFLERLPSELAPRDSAGLSRPTTAYAMIAISHQAASESSEIESRHAGLIPAFPAKSERMKVYVTKYALTTGILTAEDGEVREESPGMVSCKSLGVFANFHGKDWHKTPEAALIRAEEMCGNKIKSLEKQIAKLRVMNFKA